MNTNRIGDASLPQTPGAAAESAGVADESARREFERLYHQDRQEPPGDRPGTPPGAAAEEEYRHPPPAGSREEAAPPEVEETPRDESLASLMRGLFAERLGAPSGEAARDARAASAHPADSAAPRLAERIERLVEQVLVSRPGEAGDKEVRLMVRNSVLPDTEIRLSRGTDGLLSVTLATGRDDAFQTLVAARTELKQALDARENREVRLTVVDTRGAGAEEGGSDRRSRGYRGQMTGSED
ncbi:MAG: hypothetical protein LBE85_02655 [Candidatus Accumulibacter sp.]|jgi:type III secretion system needle length determinant|nr:hypothetical protein [Accumulibacter sp.]